ncbi:MAG: hypothetical protein IBX55_21330 [Methyloprofundus sp.]|nr:hypothetical protein [Methyloprofundus sp.]
MIIPDFLQKPKGIIASMQQHALNATKYPNPCAATIVSIATINTLLLGKVTIDSYSGLSMNQLYVFLAPTGAGKESYLKLFERMIEELISRSKYKTHHLLNQIPASAQGFHEILKDAQSPLVVLSDEIGNVLDKADKSSVGNEMMSYFMELMTKHNGSIQPSQSLKSRYEPVANPRCVVAGFTTGERFTETICSSKLANGFYNRAIICSIDRVSPSYTYSDEISEELRADLEFLVNFRPQKIGFSENAWKFYESRDKDKYEIFKTDDPGYGARLAEQIIRLAAIICISDKRSEICVEDLRLAESIRLYIYMNFKEYLEDQGGDGDFRKRILNQVLRLIKKHNRISRSDLMKSSRLLNSAEPFVQEKILDHICKYYDVNLVAHGKKRVYEYNGD